MLQSKFIKENITHIIKNLNRRGFKFNNNYFNFLYNRKKELTQQLEILYEKKKILAKKYNTEHYNSKKKSGLNIKNKISKLEKILINTTNEYINFMATIPNIVHTTVADNDTVIEINQTVNNINTPKTHIDLLQNQQYNFKKAVEMTQAKFSILNDKLSKLQRCICQFMLNTHTEQHGYKELYVPFIVNKKSLFNSGHLPKFSGDLFKIENEDLWLNPTGEVPLVNYVQNTYFKQNELPLKLVCHTTCFRKEAGSYGQNSSGLIRQHQFDKVELVQIVESKNSYAVLNDIVKDAQEILNKLNLPHRVIILGANNLGFTATKTYDLEVWFPGTQKYIEVSSCSNTETFQAYRLNAKIKYNNKKSEEVHILNGSGLAVGRVLLGIIENYQTKEGNIMIPKVLQSYMGTDIIILQK
jgi:seryl-tRNA synthetase